MVHCRLHLIEKGVCIGWVGMQRRDLALQVDGSAHFVEKVDAKNPVNPRAAGLPIGLKSMAGNFKSRKVCVPSVNSDRRTSRALVAAVPLQEVISISFERPDVTEPRLRIVVAPVSS